MKHLLALITAFLLLLGCVPVSAESGLIPISEPVEQTALYTEDMKLGFDYIPDDPYPFAIHNANRDQKKVAITMDDCYHIEWVLKSWELVTSYGGAMTFYPIGAIMKPDVIKPEETEAWRKIAASTSEIGTHTHWHSYNITKKDYGPIILYIRYPQMMLDNVLGYHYPIQTVRTPYGYYNNTNYKKASVDAGYNHVILWDISETNADVALDNVQNGSILLYHSNRADYNCLEKLVPALVEQGYELVTVTDLLGIVDYPVGGDPYVWNQSDYY